MTSLRRLTDKTYQRYLELESDGLLTPRQAAALRSHRAMVRWSETMDNPKLQSVPASERAAIAVAIATDNK